jgi:hypothetical protein
LADTPPNQKRYPQPTTQKPGCGFPVLKFLVLFCLASGAVIEVAMGNLHYHDLRLLRQLWEHLQAGDILLGDRAFGDYATLAGLPPRGVDVLARLHAKRKVDFRKAKRLGKRDGLFLWTKNPQQSGLFSAADWSQLPEQITVRVLRLTATLRGHRARHITLVTTLLDPKLYPAEELGALYLRRWEMELSLRDLKTTLGMEQLRCQSPDMAEKELLAHLLAHNLVRCLMAQSARHHAVPLQRLSFKGTLDSLRQYAAAITQARNGKQRRQLWEDLLLNIARDLLPERPHRQEPRALKRRPKQYPLLNKPRRQFKEIPHRNRCWKNNPRDYTRLN